MAITTKKDQIEQFMQTVKLNVPENANIVIFSLPDKVSRYYSFKNINDCIVFCEKHSIKNNVFFNILPQDIDKAIERWNKNEENKNKSFNSRGYKETTVCIPGFWFDMDCKDQNHAETNLPTNEEALEFIQSLNIQPTIMVESGHGFHLYFLFKEIWVFKDNEDRDKAEKMSKGFQEYIRQLAKEHGWRLDQTGDLMRMLRLPGTLNLKDPNNPIPVTIYKIEEENRYNIEDFEKYVAKENSISHMENKSVAEVEYKLAKADLIKEKCAFIKYCKENAKNLGEQHWYAALSILVRCENGQPICHEWSMPYKYYNEQETQKKLEHALESAGPRTCNSINDITNGEFCESCYYYNKIKSPIILGYENNSEQLDDESKEVANKVVQEVENSDKGRHLEQDAVNAFAILSIKNPAEYSRLRERIKDKKAPLKEFDRLVNKEIKRLDAERKANLANKYLNKMSYTIYAGPERGELNIIMPSGYMLEANGTYKIEYYEEYESKILISHCRIIIDRKYKDVDQDREIISIMWEKNGNWYSDIVDREVICDARKILMLSSKGFPVTSSNSSEIVQYLYEFEASNERILPISLVSSHLGWQGNNCNKGYLLYNTCIDSKGNSYNIEERSDQGVEMQKIVFHGETPGDEQIAKGFTQKGIYEEWRRHIEIIKDYPRVLIAFYAAFVPVLLEPLGISNFIVELANRTSTGKTTALRVAASIWGNPDEKQANSIINSWDVTRVWIERASSILYCLPLILDDTKRARNPVSVAETIYSVANGKGRGRGNIKSLATTKSWRTVLISTGETPSVFLTNDGGTRARVLEVVGKPFGETNEKTREVVTNLNLVLKENYGFAGPKFVEYVINNKEKWKEWKKRLKSLESAYAQKYKSEVSGRLSEYMAAIYITVELVNEALNLKWVFEQNSIESLWSSAVDESRDSTGEKAALQHVISWAYSNEETFEGRAEDGSKQPLRGWSGRWDRNENWEYIAFHPYKLKEILKDSGYDYEVILRGWKELGFLDVKESSPRKYQRQLRVNLEPAWLIPIKRKAINKMYDLEDEDKGNLLKLPSKIATETALF